MISAQNRLRPSNGSSKWAILVCIFFLNLHPAKSACIHALLPKAIGQLCKILPDTIPPIHETSTPKDETENIIFESQDTIPQLVSPIKKEKYEVLLLMPLNAEKLMVGNFARNKYLHYYAGVLLALQDLNTEKNNIKLRVVDTYSESYKQQLIKNQVLSPIPDLVIGPLDREEVKIISEEALDKKVTMLSPWHTSTRIANDNPFYIQLKPNLKSHFRKIVNHAIQQFNKGEIAVVTKKNKEGKSWYNYLQEQAEIQVGDKDYIFHYELHEDSLKFGTAFYNLFTKNRVSAIILPHYSFSDEEEVYHIMRKLAGEKGTEKIVVYGMPLLYESEKIDFDLHYALNTSVVMSDFVDQTDFRVKDFKRRFLEEYGEIPLNDAIKGYDLMLFAGKSLMQYGLYFQFQAELDEEDFLQAQIHLKKIQSEDSSQISIKSFFENDHLDIIEFFQARFTKIY